MAGLRFLFIERVLTLLILKEVWHDLNLTKAISWPCFIPT